MIIDDAKILVVEHRMKNEDDSLLFDILGPLSNDKRRVSSPIISTETFERILNLGLDSGYDVQFPQETRSALRVRDHAQFFYYRNYIFCFLDKENVLLSSEKEKSVRRILY